MQQSRSALLEHQKSNDNDLLRKAFLLSAWGDTKSLSIRDEIEKEVRYRSEAKNNPELFIQYEEKANLGVLAYDLGKILQKKLNQQGLSQEVEIWLAEQKETYQQEDIINHLTHHILSKWTDYQQSKKMTRSFLTKPKLDPIELNTNRLHPNQILSLPQSSSYEILIDESGTLFNNEQTDKPLHEQPKKSEIGRAVAVVIPDNKRLPELTKKFHAKDEDDESIEKYLGNLLMAKVGVIGITMNDNITPAHHSWLALISNLIRLAIISLPIDGKKTTVKIHVEHRAEYSTNVDLLALKDDILNELKNISKTRYANLSLVFELIKKEGHSYNGYVDLVANVWGSPAPFKKKLLKNTKLLPYCLLEPNSPHVIERGLFGLYALSKQKIAPSSWFELCIAAMQLKQHGRYQESVLSDFMMTLGHEIKKSPALWEQYLNEVKARLHHKNYQLNEIAEALSWLLDYKPEQSVLPKVLELHLFAVKTSLSNHYGETAKHNLPDFIELMTDLRDECSPLIAEVLLKLITQSTNSFEFDLYKFQLGILLSRSIAEVGLLNYGKLLSSKGQLFAFKGQNKEAVELFDSAILQFKRLSDISQAQREVQQTKTYRLIALMDCTTVNNTEFKSQLSDYLKQVTKKTTLKEQVIALAKSGEDNSYKYAHALLLRAFVFKTDYFEAEIKDYFSVESSWQTGETHPWELIYTYRAYLFNQQGNKEEAKSWFKLAIEECEALEGAQITTIHWIGAVIKRFAKQMNLYDEKMNPEWIETLYQHFPDAPQNGLGQSTDKDPRTILIRGLPFNFR